MKNKTKEKVKGYIVYIPLDIFPSKQGSKDKLEGKRFNELVVGISKLNGKSVTSIKKSIMKSKKIYKVVKVYKPSVVKSYINFLNKIYPDCACYHVLTK